MERQYKLLIVDDESEILATYGSYFSKRGFIVETAADGVEGLEKLRQDEFDVAIIDIKMPKMDGIELAQRVDKLGINTEIIILTGHGDRAEAVGAIKAHVKDWFDKSEIEMSKLRGVIDTAIANRVEELTGMIPPEEIRRLVSLVPEKV